MVATFASCHQSFEIVVLHLGVKSGPSSKRTCQYNNHSSTMLTFPLCRPCLLPVFPNTGICEKLHSDSSRHNAGETLAYPAHWRHRPQV